MDRLTLPNGLCGALTACLLASNTAHAHIDLVGPLESRGGDQKVGPCEGAEWGSGPVYTFEPGATITISAQEGISHDGYFRIAFDNAGEDDFVNPMSIDPLNPDRYGKGQKCAKNDPTDRCGNDDFCSFVSADGGPTVLWDKLDPHVPNGLLNGKTWTWKVTLPDVECEHCTLQVIQVMEDANDFTFGAAVPTHGPFDGKEDLYFRCIDVVLKRGKGGSVGITTGPVDNNGINCTKAVSTDGGVQLPDDDDVVVIIPDAGASDPEDDTDDGDGDGDDGHGDGDHDSPHELDGGAPSTGNASKDGCSVNHAGGSGESSLPFIGFTLLALAVRARRASPSLTGKVK